MPRDGNGNYELPSNSFNPAVDNTTISSTDWNSTAADLEAAVTASMAKDGQTTPTANQPMAGYKHTGVGDAAARDQYAAAGQIQDNEFVWVDGGGTGSAITATYSPTVTALVDGMELKVRATAANVTTTPTFSPNGLTARTIVRNGGQALAASDIYGDNHELTLRYNLSNTRWELLNPAIASVPFGGTGLLSATSYAVICGGTTSIGPLQTIASVGSSGQFLKSNGAGSLPSFATVGGRLLGAPQVFTTTGSANYTPTSGMVFCIIEMQAAGGGSGGTTGTAGQSAAGGAGGGGSYMLLYATAANIGASAVINVGAAGTAGSSGNNAGGDGGDTTIVINASTWTANGGTGGGGQTSSTSAKAAGTAGAGGTNTTGSNATVLANIPGQTGSYGFSNGSTTVVVLGAPGGDSFLGKGGAGNASGTGLAGVNYGGGAAGSLNGSGSNQAGSAGAQGIIRIWEYT